MPFQTQGKRRSAAQDVPVKRFRVSRACDQCRAGREKCDGQPTCSPCTERRRACTYASNLRKRGLPPGYIRTIELALALVFQQHADIEASLTTKLGQGNTVLCARDTKDSNRLHEKWRRSKFCRSLNKALTGEQIGTEEALSSSEESEVDAPDSRGPDESLNIPFEANSAVQHRTAPSILDHRQSNLQQQMSFPEPTPLPSGCWQLLEMYSTYIQCWLPICEKLDVLKLSYSYPSQGLVLSLDMPEAAHHAEMWSMLALGSIQDPSGRPESRESCDFSRARNFYAITRTLIPDELGKFHLSHVKALLNMAVFNLSDSQYSAAWLLVGAASRILHTIDESSATASPRQSHVWASCFLLDNLLALLSNRRPYLDRSDVARAGKIEEDGLEEWQPWGGDLTLGTANQSRLPTLALSSFNNLLEVVDVLVASIQQPSGGPFAHDAIRRLEIWKASLPPKFDYVRSDSTSIPLTPPGVLLQLTHFAAAFALAPSQMWLQQIFELMETCQKQLGFARLPSAIICVLESIRMSSASLPLEQLTRGRVHKLVTDYSMAHTLVSTETIPRSQGLPSAFVSTSPVVNTGATQTSSRSYPLEGTQPIPTQRVHAHSTSLLDELLPDMSTNPRQQGQVLQSFDPQSVDTNFPSPGLETYDPSVSGDLESFFDELASLHGAKKLQNQPQFMENLGFAPEASMADLLATQSVQYMPMQTFNMGAEHEPLQFPLSDYYNQG